MNYIGDLLPGVTARLMFDTSDMTGAGATLGGTPAVRVYKDGSNAESAAGVTLTVDFDSRTGLHLIEIDTSADGSFYASGHDFHVVLTAGTVSGVSIAPKSLGHFSLASRSVLVSSTGRVDVNDKTGFALTVVYDAAKTAAQPSDIPSAASIGAQVTSDHGVGSYVRNTEPPTAGDVAAQITSDHGSGSYVRNTEPLDSTATQAAAAAALTAYDAATGSDVDTVGSEVATVGTSVDSIKTQTDKLVFDADNNVAANTKAINDAALTGDGTSGNPWGPV